MYLCRATLYGKDAEKIMVMGKKLGNLVFENPLFCSDFLFQTVLFKVHSVALEGFRGDKLNMIFTIVFMGISMCCIIVNWTCFSFLKTFHLSSKKLPHF